MKTLLVDIGNTRIKTAITQAGTMSDHKVWQEIPELLAYVRKEKITDALVTSVSTRSEQITEALQKIISVNIFTSQTPLPVKVHYKTINTLGPDRLAAAVGAHDLFSGKNNLVIDIGTCITYDLLDKDSIFHGGAISPGLELRARAMNSYTSKLPLIQMHDKVAAKLTGDTSVSSMESGVLNGVLFEIEGFIRAYSGQYPGLNTIITGGDSWRFESTIKAHIFVAPKLILTGLNRILKENNEN